MIDARPAMGGIARFCASLIGLLETDTDVDLVLYGSAGPPAIARRRSFTRILGAPLGRIRRIARDQIGLPCAARQLAVDLVHSPNYLAPSSLQIPAVVSVHDLSLIDHFELGKTGPMRHYERWLLLRAIKGATQLVASSRSVAEEIARRWNVEGRISWIYPPPPELPTADPSHLPPTAAWAPYCLTVGVLEPRKNLERLIAAYRAVAPHLGVRLLIAGPYGWRQSAVVKSMHAAGDDVEWIGFRSDAELAALYAGAVAVVQYSLQEGYDYPVVEAMSYGTPLVLSDIPVHREIAANAAFYADPLDPESLAEKLSAVVAMSPARRAECAAAAAARLDRIRRLSGASKYAAIYRRALGYDAANG
jgi:glycosyltransferase involved in cell wall biosynthesis